MPELPDLAVVADALHAALSGRRIVRAEALAPLAVRGTPAELAALIGQELRHVLRRGKFITLELNRDRVAINAMLTGRFQLAGPADKVPRSTAVILGFGPRRTKPKHAAAWTKGASWLQGDADPAELRYRDPSQMGKVYLLPAGVTRPVTSFEDSEQGPDADASDLTIDVWRERIRRHPGELKSLLRNQAFVAGIGNAYSDEILHAAKLSPFRRRSSLAAEEVDALYEAMRSTFARASDSPAGARPADVREAGQGLSRRAPARRRGMPPLRHAHQRDQLPQRGDQLVSGLPALTARAGRLA